MLLQRAPSCRRHFSGNTAREDSRRHYRAGPLATPLVLFLLAAYVTTLVSCDSTLTVTVEHPRPGTEITYIPDIPLWVRIYVDGVPMPRSGRYCFEVLLNGESQTITCERDTILDGVIPQPGMLEFVCVRKVPFAMACASSARPIDRGLTFVVQEFTILP